jgi:hypothetical protein
MTQNGSGSSSVRDLSEWGRLLIFAIFVFALGTIGGYQWEMAHGHVAGWGNIGTWFTSAYHSVQLFALHSPHLEQPIPLALRSARALAAMVALWAGMKIILIALRTNWHSLKSSWRKGHVIICGLGRLGLPLALDAQRNKKKPVAIEKEPNSVGIRTAIRAGIPVVIGNAMDPEILERAGVKKAKRIFALTAEDDVNFAIAMAATDIDRSPDTEMLTCMAFFEDLRVSDALRESRFRKSGENCDVEVGPDTYSLRARLVLRDKPLDHLPVDGCKQATLVIAGFDRMGQALAIQAASIGHFKSKEKLRIFIVDEGATNLYQKFCARYEYFGEVCEVKVLDNAADHQNALRTFIDIYDTATKNAEPVTFAFTYDERGVRNKSLALTVQNRLSAPDIPLLVYVPTNERLSSVETSKLEPIHMFGMLESIWNFDTVTGQRHDTVARAFHDIYCDERAEARRKGKEPPKRKPADKPWEDLDETFRDANRALADHVPVKMRAIGYTVQKIEDSQSDQRVHELTGDQRDILAEMEHRRWCAERRLANWTYAKVRNDAAKELDLLKDWEELTPDERWIDENLMANICAALGKDGMGVYEEPESRDDDKENDEG